MSLLLKWCQRVNGFFVVIEIPFQAICPSFHAELVPVVSNRLMNTPMSAALFEHFFVNYGLLSPVEYKDGSVMMRHRGNAFGILRQGAIT